MALILDFKQEFPDPNATAYPASSDDLINFAVDERDFFFAELKDLSTFDFKNKILGYIDTANIEGYICSCGDKYWVDHRICKSIN